MKAIAYSAPDEPAPEYDCMQIYTALRTPHMGRCIGTQTGHSGQGEISGPSRRAARAANRQLGGLGQCGIITKVVMRLMAAPTNVLFIKMDYDDFQSASADAARNVT